MSAAATTFDALAEPARRQILELLRQRREAGLVRVRPEGQRRWYGLRAEPFAELDAWLAPYREFWVGRLDALERHLDEGEDR